MDAYCECCVLYRYKSLRRADHSSRGVLPIVVRLSVIVQHLWGGPDPLGGCCAMGRGEVSCYEILCITEMGYLTLYLKSCAVAPRPTLLCSARLKIIQYVEKEP